MSRAAGAGALFLLALVAWVFSVGFGLNGSQYDSWVTALAAMAVTLLVGAVLVLIGVLHVTVSGARAAFTALALAAVAGLAFVTTRLFPDSDPGGSSWPHTLAWLALGIFAVGLFSSFVPRGRVRS